jgi:hypothetical protein
VPGASPLRDDWRVGDILIGMGDVAGALRVYRDVLAIRERLSAEDAANTDAKKVRLDRPLAFASKRQNNPRAGSLDALIC